ncbi:hypothetical protein [Streptomyces sp. NBC_01669]|uniref:hypothetical protein n=1 Tax=Streptomyces sp. NBC_01669 TaxID=2975909 RepID=UPI00225874C6|nr:hypothetical protein [Streptomyces sp. NBC_01669]MCX4537116.1 hypothetical protein [Streptomyces sp. NBC_01669]
MTLGEGARIAPGHHPDRARPPALRRQQPSLPPLTRAYAHDGVRADAAVLDRLIAMARDEI